MSAKVVRGERPYRCKVCGYDITAGAFHVASNHGRYHIPCRQFSGEGVDKFLDDVQRGPITIDDLSKNEREGITRIYKKVKLFGYPVHCTRYDLGKKIYYLHDHAVDAARYVNDQRKKGNVTYQDGIDATRAIMDGLTTHSDCLPLLNRREE